MPKNIYRNSKGEVLPGVTTIINQLDKPALVNWAWKLGKEGKDWKAERDSAGDIGTQVHEAILASLSGEVDIKFTGDSASIALKCYEKFMDWWLEETARLGKTEVIVEQPMVSERYGFGGQPDLYFVEWERLADIKTSSGIYDSYWLQLAGYDILLREIGFKPKQYQQLWLPKDNRFGCPIRKSLKTEKQIFKHLLEIYKLTHKIGCDKIYKYLKVSKSIS